MTTTQISILIPIYNVEKYLAQCLDSVCKQTLKDIEIICINDGSTDGSLDIIKQYQAKDKRIKLINKKNTGYGDSMNQGLKTVRGKYIGIVEPDDWIERNALQDLFDLAESTAAEVIKCNFYLEKDGTSTKTKNITPQDALAIANEVYEHLFALPPAIWAALYRREFITKNHIEFLPTSGAAFQDLGFNFKTLALAQHIVLTTEAYLHYRMDNSDSSSNNPEKVKCVVAEYASIEAFLKQHHLFAKFGHYMAAAKFRNYYWNWQRLSGDTANDFYQTMQTELHQAENNGLLHRRDFNLRHWLALNLILHRPNIANKLLHRD